MKVLALAALLLGVVAAFLLRLRVTVGTEPGEPSLPTFDPRTDWASLRCESRAA